MTAVVLSTSASVLMLISTWIYFQQIRRGTSVPSLTTLSIFMVVASIETVSYFFVVQGNYVKWIVTCLATVTLGFILVYIFRRKKFGRLGLVDWICSGLAGLAILLWLITKDELYANATLQVAMVISWGPTIIGLVRGDLRERWPPWVIVIASYGFMLASIMVENRGEWVPSEAIRPITSIVADAVVLGTAIVFRHRYKGDIT